jgi:hypothetical protein
VSADHWAEVEKTWAQVNVGDVIVGKNRQLWMVADLAEDEHGQVVIAAYRDREYGRTAPPNAPVTVLVPQLELLRSELGAVPQ